MKTKLLTLAALALFSTVSFAEGSGDVTTNPEKYFLKYQDVADSVAILKAPPAYDSLAFQNDIAYYQQGISLRDTDFGKYAAHVALHDISDVFSGFSSSFGVEISKKNTPEIYKLISRMAEDAGDLATRNAKQHFKRLRPFVLFNTHTCAPDAEKNVAFNQSYPSGHTALATAVALVLSEINVDRQDDIMNHAEDIGKTRIVCGFHWKSDVDAGARIASVVVARLHANDEFNEQLAKAKAEFKKIKENLN